MEEEEMNKLLPMNLQVFAEPTPPDNGGGQQTPPANTGGQQTPPTDGQQTPPAIDYGKIQQMLDGTLSAKEDTALKAYFKQQGLSQQEAEQAISDFKAQKAEQQPDVTALQSQIASAQAEAQRAMVETAATLSAIEFGIDAKTIPYVLKMADLDNVVGDDGKVNKDTMDAAIKKVLEDIPGLKSEQQQAAGFQVGAGGNNQGQQTATNQLSDIFGNTKK